MVSTKYYSGLDGDTSTFLSDFSIKSEQYCRVYNYMYDPDGVDGELQPNGLYNRVLNTPNTEDLATLEKWTLIDNIISFYTAPAEESVIVLEVASTPEELGDVLAGTAGQQAQDAAEEAKTYRDEADVSATNASTSETNASTSASSALTSELNAAASATDASTSEDAAAVSSAEALASELAASNSADTAGLAATSALTSKDAAELAATNASASEASVAADAASASTSASNAAVSEANAAQSAIDAATFDPSSYYTKVLLDGGQLDNRYYTETETDSKYATKANAAFTGTVTLETSTATDAIGGVPMQYRTLTANSTLTDGLSEGQQVKLVLTNGGFTIDSTVVTWWEGEVPTLGTTDEFEFYKLNGVLRGKHTGSLT